MNDICSRKMGSAIVIETAAYDMLNAYILKSLPDSGFFFYTLMPLTC